MLDDFYALDATDSLACDHFFEKWGAGNTLHGTDRQLERFFQYESLLNELRKADEQKYTLIHKGTPFYFLGWLSFDMRNYETANFYMSAALAEDRRKSPKQPFETWINGPAGSFMLLRETGSASKIVASLRNVLQEITDSFNAANPGVKMSVDVCIEKFVRPMLENEHYSVVTAFYSFVLEYHENLKNLSLTAGSVDSTEPVLANLLKGSLIIETIVKHYYPRSDGVQLTSLNSTLNTQTSFGRDFKGVVLSHSDNTLQAILSDASDLSYKTVIETSLRIRNTTGHRLLWDNIFNNPDNYQKLFEQEVFAILYVLNIQ